MEPPSRSVTRPRSAVNQDGNIRLETQLVEESNLSSHILNGEDLGPIIRQVFEHGKPEALLHQLRAFVRKKELEIEELCKVHYEEFIHAVDELRYVLVDADELKHGLNMQNVEMQDVGNVLLRKLEDLIESHGVKSNLGEAIEKLKLCKHVVDLCIKANEALAQDSYYQALKTLETIERDHLAQVPSLRLKAYIESQIPICRSHVERRVNLEFQDWLVQIRAISREIGKSAVGQAAAARQREMDLSERQRQAEEQTRSGLHSAAYMLQVEDADEDGTIFKFDVTPVYRAHYINTCLGLEDQFRDYYFENRKLQLSSDLQFTSGQFVPQAFNHYCSQVTGFFIVEDRVMRTAGTLISPGQVDNLWELAVARLKAVMEDQFGRMSTSEHMLLVKDDASLFCAALRRFGFQVGPILEVMDSMRDKYHEHLLVDCRRQIADALANDKFEQMMMKKEYEYSMNVLAFHIQSTDSMPAFPYVAPFSSSVPEICRIVRGFIDSSVSFLQHSGQLDQYDAVKKYLDRLLVSVLNESMLRIIQNPNIVIAHAMQLAANTTVLERACSFFAEHSARLCGIPARLVEGSQGALSSRAVLRKSQQTASDTMMRLITSKINETMRPEEQIPWMPNEPSQGNEYLVELLIFLETILDTARQLFPLDAFETVSSGMLKHISDKLAKCLCGDSIKRFNLYAIQGCSTDLQTLDNFADSQFEVSGLDQIPGVQSLKIHLAEFRQMVNLILSNQPEHYMSRSVREKSYFALKPEKVIIICDKYRDPGEVNLLFGGSRNSKQVNKKKSLESLAKRLREDLSHSGGGLL